MFHITHNGDEVVAALNAFIREVEDSIGGHHWEPGSGRSRCVTVSRSPVADAPLTMIEVSSRCLRAVGYDGAGQRLHLQFHHGWKVYTFYRVPAEVYGGLMAATSKGDYYHQHIKGRYCQP